MWGKREHTIYKKRYTNVLNMKKYSISLIYASENDGYTVRCDLLPNRCQMFKGLTHSFGDLV